MNNKLLNFGARCLLLLCITGGSLVNACEKQTPAASAPIIRFTVGFNESDARYAYVDCVLNRALHRLAYRSELIAAPVGRELFDVVEGRADAIAATTDPYLWPIQVENLIRLDDPFVTVTNVVFTRVGVPTPHSWQALAESDLQIVMARHHSSAQAYLAQTNAFDVEGVDQAIAVFLADRAEALVTFEANEEIQMLAALSGPDIAPPVELSDSILYTYIHERFEALVPALNTAIQAEIADNFWNLHE